MKNFQLAASLLLVLNTSVAVAQDASRQHPQPPSGPLLATAPSYSQWVVTYSYPDERPAASATPAAPAAGSRTKFITTTKTDDIVHEEIVDNAGKKYEIWHRGTTEYSKAPGSPFWAEIRPSAENGKNTYSGYSPMPPSGFKELELITKANYVGETKTIGKNCLVFAQNQPAGWSLSGTENIDSLGEAALVDAESRLPVQAQMGGIIRTYHFNAPPTDKLTLPDDLRQQLKAGAEARARLAEPAARPY